MPKFGAVLLAFGSGLITPFHRITADCKAEVN